MTNEITIRHMEYGDFYIDRTGESLYSTGSITIDWGDGTVETTNNNTYSYSHNYHNFVYDNEGYQTYDGYITITVSGVEEIRDGFLVNEYITEQYVDAVTIPDNITSIGDNFCYNQEHLHYLTLSNSLTTIGDNFCYGCYLSNGLELPDSLTSIGDNFCNVAGYLDTLILPDSITTIGDNFCASSGLTSFTIPNSITSIGDYFLDECGFLTGDIVIPNSVESIGHDFLAGCGMTSIIFENNSAIDVIPDDFARKCMNLTNISFPDNLETIGTNFCCNCPSLTRVEFPEGLIEIGENFLNGEEELMHLNKLIFPSSFRYLNDGLTGASIDKVIFKSVIPVDMSAGYPDQFDSMIIHVPKNCVNAYANAFTEAFGDYGEDSLSDPNHYRENLTLPEATTKIGTLLRTNLGRKGIETNINDGLTTLSEKVNDIELWEEPTGFFADMGLYNLENWFSSSQPPTFIDDKIILNEGATFVFPSDYEFPDTFTAACFISSSNTTDYIDWGNVSVRNDFGCSGEGNFKQLVILKRNNGGDFEIEILPSINGYTVSTPQDYINFYPSNSSTMTISNLYYTNTYYNGDHGDDYTLYDLLTYSIIWDDNYNISNTRPEKLPAFLLQNNNISEYYDISANYAGNYTIPYNENGDEWGCWTYQHPNNENEYVWKSIDDFRNTDDYLQHYYSCIKGSGQERIDRYILGLAKSWSSFEDNETFFDNESLEPFWEVGFDYTFDGTSNDNKDAYVQIGPDNECIQCGVINGSNVFNIVGDGDSFATSYLTSMHCKFGIHEMHTKNGRFYITYYVEINGDKRFHSASIFQNNMNKICPFDLYKVVQHSNAKITNLYYKNNNVALWDSCKKNPINGLYGSSVPFFGNSSNTLTYSNDEYILQGSGNYFSGRRIQVLDGINNGLVRVKFKLNGQGNNPAFNQLFICCTDETPSSTETTYPYATRVRDDKLFQYFQFTSESTIYTHNTTYSSDWFYLEATKEGQYWTMKLYDETFYLLAESTEHIQSTLDNPNWYIGTQTEMGTNYSVHIQEIYAEKLLYLDS